MTTVRLDPRRLELIGIALIAVLILIFLPLVLDIFRLNLVGKYLTYAFVAIGLVLCWGQTGILSLGQGLFFGLGGYCMAAFLKLEASSVANTKIQSTPGIPDFMDWNQITALPFFWVPFKCAAVRAHRRHRRADASLAFILGAAHVQAAGRRRLFCHHHPGAGAGDDHPDRRPAGLYRRHQWHHRSAHAAGLGHSNRQREIYPLLRLLRPAARRDVPGALRACQQARPYPRRRSATRRIASVSPATTWPTTRFSFSAWRPPWPRVGGAMFTLQVGFMSPSFVGIVPSIEMVIFCAVGGRNSIVGAVAGTLLVNSAKTMFSEQFPGTLAVRDGRVVHRRCRLPSRAGSPAW